MQANTYFEQKCAVLEQAFLDLLNIVAQDNAKAAACKAIYVKMAQSHIKICNEHGIEVPDEQATQVSEGEGVSGKDSGSVQLGQPDNGTGAS